MTSSWKRNRLVILASLSLALLGVMMVMPFVPLYVQELGETDPSRVALWSGAALGISGLEIALLLPLWDRLAERTGRKFQVLRSLVGSILGLSAMWAARSAWQLLAAFMFEGLISGFYPQFWTLMSVSAPAGGASEAVSLLWSMDLVISAIAPFMGGFIADQVGFRPIYILAAILVFLGLIVMWVGYHDEPGEVDEAPADRPKPVPLRSIMTIPGLFPLLAMTFIFACLAPGIYPLLPIYMQSLASPDTPMGSLVGITTAIGYVAGALASLALGRMVRRFSSRNLTAICFVSGGLSTSLIAAIPSLEAVFVTWVIRSALTGGIIVTLYGIAEAHLAPRVAKDAYANLTVAIMVGYSVGMLVTAVLGAMDLRGAFVAVGALLVLAGLWTIRAYPARPQTPQGSSAISTSISES
jgi:DHA1 family multidrug resistance protein-like MFS transporter